MMKIEESVIIHRRPEEVFAFLEVRSNDAAWMASVVESEWLNPTAADLAALDRRRSPRPDGHETPGRHAEFFDEVTDYEPGRRIAHRTVRGPIPLKTACICERTGDGCRTTVVGATARLPGGLLGRIAAPLVALVIRRGFKADLARLKKILESEGDATG